MFIAPAIASLKPGCFGKLTPALMPVQQGIEKYGLPLGLYSDRHTIFRSPKESLSLEQELAGEIKRLSQFGKAMAELGITHIKAMTPQAKGRIERLWGTFQDRLVIELRLLGVSTLEEANRALPELIEKHKRTFAVEPQEAESAYRPLPAETDLEYVFAVRTYRQIGSGQTLSYGGKLYTLAEKPSQSFEAKTSVEVRETMQGKLVIWHKGQALELRETQKPSRRQKPETKTASPAPPRKLAASHPWRKPWSQKQIQPLLPVEPRKPKGGRPRMDNHQAMTAIFYVLRTGIQWKALPHEMGAACTVYDRFQYWQKQGVFKRMWEAGLQAYNEFKGIEWTWQAVDGAMIKAPLGGKGRGPNPTDRGKRGAKRSLWTDGRGIPWASL